jgi:hypothetical protein
VYQLQVRATQGSDCHPLRHWYCMYLLRGKVEVTDVQKCSFLQLIGLNIYRDIAAWQQYTSTYKNVNVTTHTHTNLSLSTEQGNLEFFPLIYFDHLKRNIAFLIFLYITFMLGTGRAGALVLYYPKIFLFFLLENGISNKSWFTLYRLYSEEGLLKNEAI